VVLGQHPQQDMLDHEEAFAPRFVETEQQRNPLIETGTLSAARRCEIVGRGSPPAADLRDAIKKGGAVAQSTPGVGIRRRAGRGGAERKQIEEGLAEARQKMVKLAAAERDTKRRFAVVIGVCPDRRLILARIAPVRVEVESVCLDLSGTIQPGVLFSPDSSAAAFAAWAKQLARSWS